jgi:hypothetical protein
VGETILAYLMLAAGFAVLAYATIGRLCGFHRPIRWAGGGYVSFAGELSLGVFVLCFGLATLQHSAIWGILALTALGVLIASHRRAWRRHVAAENELRARNAGDYPGVFDNPPPDDIDRTQEDEFDLFDAGACTYLGKAAKKDIKALIDRFSQIPEQGPNDIFMLVESLETIGEGSISDELMVLLKKAFEERDFLVLRWMPPLSGAV